MAVRDVTYDEMALLSGINAREKETFGRLYSLLFYDLYYYTSKLYQDTEEDAGDVVQDVFLSFYQNGSHNFSSISNVKAYLLISIQNRFKNYLRQNYNMRKYLMHSLSESNKFQADVFEAEIFSLFHHVLNILPEETAEIFKLFFMGWTAEEIAADLGKSKQTIYNIKSQAMSILRDKLSKEAMIIIITMLS